MFKIRYLAVIGFSFLISFIASADEADLRFLSEFRADLPLEGELLLGNTVDASRLNLLGASEAGKLSVVPAEEQVFSQAVRAEIIASTDTAYTVQVITRTNSIPIKKGDVLFLSFTARCLSSNDESGEGLVSAYLQQKESPWTSLVSLKRSVGKEWRRFYLSTVAENDWDMDTVNLTFHLSPYIQTIELGGIVALNLGADVDHSKLPFNKITYAGREPDAPWRAEAQKRIDQYRKGNLSIEVIDVAGNPVENVPVHVKMTRHAYGFGSFFDANILDEEGELTDDNARHYAEWYLKFFNKATTPVYWADWGWANPRQRENYHRKAAWLQEQGIPTRGHVLIWPGWRYLPTDLQELEDNPEELRRTTLDHITEVVTAMKKYNLIEYDVMNEPRVNHDLMDILGDDIVEEWYKTAYDADGRQTLYINEYSLITNKGRTTQEQETYETLIRRLLNNGAPIGGIGFQGHMGEELTPPERIIQVFDRFASFGLPLQITEFDVDIADEATQADYTRDFFTAVFSHPSTVGIVQWGFWEGSHWKPNGAMVREDWSLKPNGQTYLDLIYDEWWTDETGTTGPQGEYSTRGFCGEYTVTVGDSDTATTHTLTLPNTDATLQIQVP